MGREPHLGVGGLSVAIIKKADITITDLDGRLETHPIPSKPHGSFTGAFQMQNGQIVYYSYTAPTTDPTEAQELQKARFCQCDALYRNMTIEQLTQWRLYLADHPEINRDNQSIHTAWMRECMKDRLANFFHDVLKLRCSPIIRFIADDQVNYLMFLTRDGADYLVGRPSRVRFYRF